MLFCAKEELISIAKHNLEIRYFIIPTGSTFIFKFAFVLPHSLTCISLIYSFRSLCYDTVSTSRFVPYNDEPASLWLKTSKIFSHNNKRSSSDSKRPRFLYKSRKLQLHHLSSCTLIQEEFIRI